MRFIHKIWILILVVALGLGTARAANFTAALDRDTLTLGESAVLSLTFEGGSPKNLATPDVPGLHITQSGTAQNMSIVNGSMTSSLTVSFTVSPQREGEFTIPVMQADFAGQQLSTPPLKLVVSKPTAPTAEMVNSGNEVAFLKLTCTKQKVHAGENLLVQLDLYLRDDVQNFGNFQLTAAPTEGFSPGKTVELQNQRRRVQVGNRAYTIIPLALPLTAVKTGILTLGPFAANTTVVLPRGFFGEQRQVNLATEELKLESLPLPAANRPANFSGAIGQFTLTASAGPTDVTVGDPITVRVQISGRGSLDSLVLPVPAAWKNFKTYPPTTKLETSDQFGFQGRKTFEQIISPLNNDVRELPALTFSYFDPEDGQYHTLTQPAVPLTVKAAGATPLPQLAANKPEEKTAQDILPIKEKIGSVTQGSTEPLLTKPAFLVAQSVPVLAFLAAFIWRKRTDNLANNPRLRRQRAVAEVIAFGMKDLKSFAAQNKPDDFFATLFRLLQEQLGERLNCPASAITEDVVGSHPVLRTAPLALRTALEEQFQLCNQARYASVRGTSELNSVAAEFEKLLAELQNLKS